MSERKPWVLVRDILNSIVKIRAYTDSLSFETLSVNYMIMETCLYNIQVIGEAVSKMRESIRKESGLLCSVLFIYFFGGSLPYQVKEREEIFAIAA